MNPQHNDPSRPERRAHAPYNFVRLPETVITVPPPLDQDQYHPELLTGSITCTLTTASPLYVRAFRTLQQYQQKGEDGRPPQPEEHAYGEKVEDLIIPGSSLRGMLRSMVEIISFSRAAPVTDKALYHRSVENTSMGIAYRKRMAPDKVCAGFFHQDKKSAWITPALAGRVEHETIETTLGPVYTGPLGPRHIPNPDLQHTQVYVRLKVSSREHPNKIFTVEEFATGPGEGLEPGMLVITGDMPVRDNEEPKKKKEFVFVKFNTLDKVKISPELVERFLDDDQITQYQKNAFPDKGGRKRKGGLKDGEPVFYLPDESGQMALAFGRAYMFRLLYQHSPAEMIPAAINPPDGLDLAEALFGRVDQPGDSRGSVAGRVFISDARFKGDASQAIWEEPVVVSTQALSSPKPTSFQHYLTQRYPDHKEHLDHYDDEPGVVTTLRGHKLYWHVGGDDSVKQRLASPSVTKPRTFQDGSVDPNDRSVFRPVKAGQVFPFTIRFENLRDYELGALMWILQIANTPKYRLKIGMAKPFGMGSVAIEPSYTLENREMRYTKLFTSRTWNPGQIDDKDKCNAALTAFIQKILKNPLINPDNLSSLEALSRINDLLALLTWEGRPAEAETRYMQPVKVFKDRKVLPTAHAMLTGQYPTTSPKPPPLEEFDPPPAHEPPLKTSADDFLAFLKKKAEEEEDE